MAKTAYWHALKWLADRNGDGTFMKDGVLLAAGDRAGFTRGTWNTLRDLRLVEFYEQRRVRITDMGKAALA